MDQLIGKSFGPYRVEGILGEGGMAVVYRGFQESLNRHVAIKVLRGDLARDQTFIARFRREALAVAGLSHPNILHVYDAGMDHGVYYLVMDYVPGGSLQDLMARGPLEPERAATIVAQIADALDYAHQQGIVHRDVKPSNILMTRDGRPLLTDFGIAKALYGSTHLTRTGSSIGTPAYMAPEQAEGQPTDGRTDIYALGIVLFEMVTGKVPFHADTPMAVLYKQLHATPPPLTQVSPYVPEWLGSAVQRALEKQPAARFQRASELATALRQRKLSETGAGTAYPVTRQSTPPPQPVVSTGERRPAARAQHRSLVPVLVGIILVIVIGLVAAGTYLLFGPGGQAVATDTPPVITQVITSEVVTQIVTPEYVTQVVTGEPSGRLPTAGTSVASLDGMPDSLGIGLHGVPLATRRADGDPAPAPRVQAVSTPVP